MTSTLKNYTPGSWYLEENYIKNQANETLAIYINTQGDENNQTNAKLMASAPDLLAACKFALTTLANMTTQQFSNGADKEIRDFLRATIKPFLGEETS